MALQLDTHHYESIVAVIETGSMKLAAERLQTSQSALSHRIAEAERRLGGELFDRRPGRAVRPTDAARSLYQTAAALLPELERAEQAFAATAGTTRRVVRVGVGTYDAYHWLPEVSEAMQDLDLTIDLAVVGDDPGARLADSTIDVVLAPGVEPGRHLTRRAFDDELVLVAHPDHPLAHQSTITADQLVDVNFLTHSATTWPGFEYDRFVRPAGVRPRLVTIIEQTSAITEMVAAGLGVSILSRWALSPTIETGRIVAVHCGEGLPLQWSTMIRRADADGPPHIVADLLSRSLDNRGQV